MTSAIRLKSRPALLVAALAVAGSALTACGTGPSQVNAALIIGDRVVSVDSVQERLDMALRNEPAAKELAKNRKLDLVSRRIVTELVRLELLTEAAKREGISVSEQDIAEYVAGAAPTEEPLQRSVEAAFSPQERARVALLATELGAKYLDKLQITFDGAQLPPTDGRQKAEELAKKVAAAPDRSQALFAEASGPQGQPINGLQFSSVSGAILATERQVLAQQLLGVPAGNVIAFSLGGGQEGGGSWLVAFIRDRSTTARLDAEEAARVQGVPPEWNQLVGMQIVGSLTDQLGIRISPRYGVWDKLAVALAPSEAETSGVVVPVPSKKP